MMDRRSIATGVLSISAPGTHFGDDSEARATARDVNEFGAEPAKDRPDRSGFFAGVPLPDTILYGSDFPFAPEASGPVRDAFLDGYDGFEPGRLDAIDHGNTQRLFTKRYGGAGAQAAG